MKPLSWQKTTLLAVLVIAFVALAMFGALEGADFLEATIKTVLGAE